MHWLAVFLGLSSETGRFYAFWSGFGGSIPDILILTAIAGWLHHNNCAQHRCWRLGRHVVDGTGIRTCRLHHPVLSQHRKLTAEHILHLHREAQERAQPAPVMVQAPAPAPVVPMSEPAPEPLPEPVVPRATRGRATAAKAQPRPAATRRKA